MSYCRFGEKSDVYVIKNKAGIIECLGCRLVSVVYVPEHEFPEPLGVIAGHFTYGYFLAMDADMMLVHLRMHSRAGHDVPEHAIERLIEEHKNGASAQDEWLRTYGGTK